MKKVGRFISMDDVYRNAVLRFVPKLEGQELETKFKTGIDCPKCGQSQDNSTGAIFYRVNNSVEWIQLVETFECSKCRSQEALNVYM